MASAGATVSVVIACYSEGRWDQLLRAIHSVLAQTRWPDCVYVVVDHNPSLLRRLQAEKMDVKILANRFAAGAGGARNTGAFAAETELIAFLDDDIKAQPQWLERLLYTAERSVAAGIGGGVAPAWATKEPWWFPREFDWVFGLRRPESPGARDGYVRNVWSENMLVPAVLFTAAGGFRDSFGKVGLVSEPEDTDLCLRLSRLSGRPWALAMSAMVEHEVPASRARFGFFIRRCWMEGTGKAALASLDRSGAALSDERSYVTRVLGLGIASHALDALRGRVEGIVRAFVIFVGLAATTLGFLTERLFGTFRRRTS